MFYFQLFWVDPLISLLIAFYLIKASYSLLIESIDILMQGVPKNLNIDKIKEDIENFKEISNIHHLHVWRLNDHNIHLEAHIDFKENLLLKDANDIALKIEEHLQKSYHISHITLQAEYDKDDNKSLLHN